MVDETDVDIQLVKQVQKGNTRAFDALVIRYQHRIHRLVQRYVHNHNEASDVVQETFIKAYNALPTFRADSAFYSWLYRIAINTAKNHLIAKDRRPPDVDIDYVEMEDSLHGIHLGEMVSPEGIMLRDEIEAAVFKAVDALTDELRTTLVLRELAGMSYEEIAVALDCPVGTVRSRLFRARENVITQILPLLSEDREDKSNG